MTPEAPLTSFASDNTSGILPEVLAAMSGVNSGPAIGYGDDPFTQKLQEQMNELFKQEVTTLLAYGGTGANVVGRIEKSNAENRKQHSAAKTDGDDL